MALPLARRLGLRTSARVLRALGHLRNQATAVPFERPGVMDRAGFLQLGAGLAVAAGVIVAGATPAFAEKKCATAAAWVTKNKERLPRTYDEFIEYPMAYRRAIFAALPATAKSMLWAEQLTRYQAANQLSPEQAAVIRTGQRLLRPALYEQAGNAEAKRGLEGLTETAVSAFGPKTGRALFGTLGPADPAQHSSRELPDNSCTCSTASNKCDNDTYCQSGFCATSSWGCGDGWFYECDGLCIQ